MTRCILAKPVNACPVCGENIEDYDDTAETEAGTIHAECEYAFYHGEDELEEEE